ncbi:hypothetical protein Asppvi_007062 [Aspergillus pseudoviridinutans]|uniref:HypA-like protein n=1 Tax=Aspergillus pseudoviridinutans TaxID=1517512 RepID=A0A9P3BC20_9EURO|nr:uncharacterized protein Asppvi_007062 [Aspergillus pseudoviridinutans]GIJ88145.1 hypothetical protein Asppvi_007062 [Aspergillus pseudoviridinutans]
MATPSVIALTSADTGMYDIGVNGDSLATVNQFLQENHDRYHPFFNDKGFHNHITHYMLAALALGATPWQLTRAFEQEKAIQRAQLPPNASNVAQLSDEIFFRNSLGQEVFYTDFLVFFQNQIAAKGVASVLNEHLFSRTKKAELLFTRLFASFLHPLIHLGYGVEFNQPAIVAEALAQTAVHKNEVAVVMLGTEAAAPATAGQTETKKQDAPSLLDLLSEVQSKEGVRDASCWGDGSWIEDIPLTKAPEELWNIAAKWRVTADELEARTAEMINVNAYFCGAAQMPPKECKLDFFLIHNLNCSIFFAAFLKQDWLAVQDKIRLLEWKGRFDVISYAARGSPKLDLQEIRNYKPRRPGTGWKDLFRRVNDFDDDSHVTKFLRGLAHGQRFCLPYQGNVCFPLPDELWLQIGHMAMDSTEKEPVARNRWVRGAGFPSQWDHFHDRM